MVRYEILPITPLPTTYCSRTQGAHARPQASFIPIHNMFCTLGQVTGWCDFGIYLHTLDNGRGGGGILVGHSATKKQPQNNLIKQPQGARIGLRIASKNHDYVALVDTTVLEQELQKARTPFSFWYSIRSPLKYLQKPHHLSTPWKMKTENGQNCVRGRY